MMNVKKNCFITVTMQKKFTGKKRKNNIPHGPTVAYQRKKYQITQKIQSINQLKTLQRDILFPLRLYE